MSEYNQEQLSKLVDDILDADLMAHKFGRITTVDWARSMVKSLYAFGWSKEDNNE